MRSVHGPAPLPPLPAQLPSNITRLVAHESLLGWTQQEDEQFWRDIGGMRGMFRLRRDMVTLAKVGGGSDFLTGRATAVTICVLLMMCSFVARLFFRGMPHIAARIAATLYFEAHLRAENARAEVGLKLLESASFITDKKMNVRYDVPRGHPREARNPCLSTPAAGGSAAVSV